MKKHDMFTPLVGERAYRHVEHICSHFGCGKTLTLVESIAGSRCVEHMGQENIRNDQINFYCLKKNFMLHPENFKTKKQ